MCFCFILFGKTKYIFSGLEKGLQIIRFFVYLRNYLNFLASFKAEIPSRSGSKNEISCFSKSLKHNTLYNMLMDAKKNYLYTLRCFNAETHSSIRSNCNLSCFTKSFKPTDNIYSGLTCNFK